MEETIEFTLNDTYRSIGQTIEKLKAFESPLADYRVKAILITQLEEAQLRSLQLIKAGCSCRNIVASGVRIPGEHHPECPDYRTESQKEAGR